MFFFKFDTTQLNQLQGVEVLAAVCQKKKARLIQLSTDYVYGEHENVLLHEELPCKPINFYGVTKLEAEQSILNTKVDATILRCSWIFGEPGPNFVQTMIRLADQRESLRVINDQIGSPTSSIEIARVIVKLIDQMRASDCPIAEGCSEIYNFSCRGTTSWYDFAHWIFKNSQSRCPDRILKTLEPIRSSDYPTQAQRQHNSQMKIDKITRQLQWQPSTWQQAGKDYLNKILPIESVDQNQN